jgi:hypothetical protein
MYHSACEAVWARSFLGSLKLLDLTAPTRILSDCAPAIKLSKNDMVNSRSKHFPTKYHFTREKIHNSELTVHHLPTAHNIADLFTKPLGPTRFQELARQLGLQPRSECVKALNRDIAYLVASAPGPGSPA